MTRSEMQIAIVSAWKAVKPLSNEAALSIANTILEPYPTEQRQFADWFEKNGESVLKDIHG